MKAAGDEAVTNEPPMAKYSRNAMHGNRPSIAAGLLLALASVASAVPSAFDDGVFIAEALVPVAGYFVPPATLRQTYAVTPADVIASARRMPEAELAAYARGGADILLSSDFLLFVYPNQGAHAFLWTGRRSDGEQQILVRAWDGRLWNGGGHSDGRSDANEIVFAAPPGADVVYVLVELQGGPADRWAIRTERVCLARFPGTAAILLEGLATSDVVVSLQARPVRAALPSYLDCLKGWVDVPTFAAIPGAGRLAAESLVFLRKGADGKLEIRFSYRLDGGRFEGPHGPIEGPASDRSSTELFDLRFRLARLAAAVLNTAPSGPGDVVVELSIGRDAPFDLFQRPWTRSGREGGEALFRFEVLRGGAAAEIAPLGRFGSESFGLAAERLEPCDALGFDYRFISCGSGVVKLLLRPRSRPFEAEVTAIVTPVERSAFRPRSVEAVRSNTLAIALD